MTPALRDRLRLELLWTRILVIRRLRAVRDLFKGM